MDGASTCFNASEAPGLRGSRETVKWLSLLVIGVDGLENLKALKIIVSVSCSHINTYGLRAREHSWWSEFVNVYREEQWVPCSSMCSQTTKIFMFDNWNFAALIFKKCSTQLHRDWRIRGKNDSIARIGNSLNPFLLKKRRENGKLNWKLRLLCLKN